MAITVYHHSWEVITFWKGPEAKVCLWRRDRLLILLKHMQLVYH